MAESRESNLCKHNALCLTVLFTFLVEVLLSMFQLGLLKAPDQNGIICSCLLSLVVLLVIVA